MLEPCLIIFAKAPQAGKVKTRMQPVLDAQQAADLHKNLVLTCLRQTQGPWSRQLWCSPHTEHDFFQACKQEFHLDLYQQQGTDLGRRMGFAMQKALDEGKLPVIIGTDCPDLESRYIKQAFNALQQHSVVLGPAQDGGYVLLGLNQYVDALFHDIAWGSDSVLQTSINRLEQSALAYTLLDTLADVDRPEDLQRMKNKIKNGQSENTCY